MTGEPIGANDASVNRVRALARHDPQQAIDAVAHDTTADPVVLAVLGAELLLRLGQRVGAAEEAARAVRLAEGGSLQMPAMTVYADLACTTGSILDATEACTLLQDLAAYQLVVAHPHLCGDGIAPEPEHCQQVREALGQALPRMRLARVLGAVATYHTDCQAGRAQLHRMHCTQTLLHRRSPLITALGRGIEAMDAWCTPPWCGPTIVTRPLTPVPGGLLQPDPARVSTAWLTDRIRAKACAGTHSPSSPALSNGPLSGGSVAPDTKPGHTTYTRNPT
ncbi:hypothetical protein ACIA5C_47055 [Actinoplanes sp. NPDC051343]|uniref:hypothetical protein n=1 Tax=Actinoplanes sp. NPDC051343 TaxID=3363906 RepID=UPI003789C2AD